MTNIFKGSVCMKKSVLSAANFHQQKHYYNDDDYAMLPPDVKKEIKQIVVYLAEKVHGTVSVGFMMTAMCL